MSDKPVVDAAANLALLQYLATPTTQAPCPDCSGEEPEDMCAQHRESYWADVLADRAEANRDER